MSALMFQGNINSSSVTRLQVLAFCLVTIMLCFTVTTLFVNAMGHHPSQYHEDPPKVSEVLTLFAVVGGLAATVASAGTAPAVIVSALAIGSAATGVAAFVASQIESSS